MFQRLLSFALLLIAAGHTFSYGQEIRASISGIVTDPTGAPVAGAVVTTTSVATNSSVATITNEAGSFLTPFLAPGSYTLAVERTGFKKFVHQNIVLESLDKVRV